VEVEKEAVEPLEPIPRWGSLLREGGFIEPVHEKGGYRILQLTGR